MKIAWAIIGVAAVIIVITAIASASSHSNNSTPAASNSPAAAASSNPGDASQPTTQPAAQPTTQAPPQMTASQQSALQAAEQYLQDEPGFSYQGLINQLDSPAGNGFSVADATFAVNNLSPAPNWNQQAAIAAKNYMTTVGGFSACSMVQQLDSPDGSDFTQAQAEYGAQAVGLGTC
jgi:Host cell surface-exposed lipoprotein